MKEQLIQSWWLIALSISTGVAGQAAIKVGLTQSSNANLSTRASDLIMTIIHSPLVLLGLFFYGLGAISWIAVLSRLNLSYAYPFLALNFVFIALVAWLALGEPISGLRWLGIGVICIGICLVGLSGL